MYCDSFDMSLLWLARFDYSNMGDLTGLYLLFYLPSSTFYQPLKQRWVKLGWAASTDHNTSQSISHAEIEQILLELGCCL
jgi:phage terminase large subunit-like protein